MTMLMTVMVSVISTLIAMNIVTTASALLMLSQLLLAVSVLLTVPHPLLLPLHLTHPCPSATDFLMDSPRRNRFLVSVEEDFSKTRFVPVITCSDDVPRMHFLADLPALGSVAAGAIAGLFTRKLELCCLQVSHQPALISIQTAAAFCFALVFEI